MDQQNQFTLPANGVAIFLQPEPVIIVPDNDPDGHCLILDNLTVNQTMFVTLDLVNICDKRYIIQASTPHQTIHW